MNLIDRQSWDELTRPARWPERLRPAMEALEARLPGRLGAGMWLYRNVSWSDLERIGASGTHPPTGAGWPLMYLVGCCRKAVLGFQLVQRRSGDPEGEAWSTMDGVAEGLPCFRCALDAEDPAGLEEAVERICGEVQKLRERQEPQWQCNGEPAELEREGGRLTELGLVQEESGRWSATERGEDGGLMTVFAAGPGGKAVPRLCWSPATRKALLGGGESGRVPWQERMDRLEGGLASCDAYAAEAVRRLAELPLEEYFRPCPEVGRRDIRRLRAALDLPAGCRFRTAAAVLYCRLARLESRAEQNRLMPLLALAVLPAAGLDEAERTSVVKNFRKGLGLT